MLNIIYDKYILAIFKDKNNILIFLVTFIIGVIAHFDFFVNEHLIIDNINSGIIYVASTWERGIGRWFISFIDSLRNGLVARVPIFFIYLTCLSISTILIIKTLKIKNKLIISLCAILIVVYPTIIVTLLFTYTVDSYAISMLLASLAAYLMNRDDKGKKKRVLNIISVICMILSLALYQVYLQVTIVLCVFVSIFKLLENQKRKEIIKRLFINALLCIISLIIYYVSIHIVLKFNNEVIGTYRDIDKFGIKSIDTYLYQIKFSYQFFYDLFFSDEIIINSNLYREYVHGIFVVCTIIMCIYIIYKSKVYKNVHNIFYIIILILLLPIFANILNIAICNYWINEVMFMVYLLFYFFTLKLLDLTWNNLKFVKIILITSYIYINYTFLISGYTSYTLRQQIFYDCYTDMNNIFSRIKNIEAYGEKRKILFVGNLEHQVTEFEEWNKSTGLLSTNILLNEILTMKFSKRYLGENYNICSHDEYLEIINTEEYKNMSLYPDRYAIKVVKDIVVVKIREDY